MSTIADALISMTADAGEAMLKVKGFIDSDGQRKAILWNGRCLAGERTVAGEALDNLIEGLASCLSALGRDERDFVFSEGEIRLRTNALAGNIALEIGLFSICGGAASMRKLLSVLARTLSDEPYFAAG